MSPLQLASMKSHSRLVAAGCMRVCAHVVARPFCTQDLTPDLHPTSLVADTVAGQIAKVRKVRTVVCEFLPVVLRV